MMMMMMMMMVVVVMMMMNSKKKKKKKKMMMMMMNTALYPVNIYELAALYCINININTTVQNTKLKFPPQK